MHSRQPTAPSSLRLGQSQVLSSSRNGTEAGRAAAATCTTCRHSAAKECGKGPGTPAFSWTLSDSPPGTRRK